MISSLFGLYQDSLESYPLLDHRYRLLVTLGEGRHAKYSNLTRVKLARDEKTGQFVAAKILHKHFNEVDLTLLYNEVRALLLLKKPANTYTQKIVNFNFFAQISHHNKTAHKTAYFAMPIEEHGEFYNLVEKTQGFSEPAARILFRDLVEGRTLSQSN